MRQLRTCGSVRGEDRKALTYSEKDIQGGVEAGITGTVPLVPPEPVSLPMTVLPELSMKVIDWLSVWVML